MKIKTFSPELLHKMDAYWRAANYLSVGQIYLFDNPLLKQPLTLEHIKPRGLVCKAGDDNRWNLGTSLSSAGSTSTSGFAAAKELPFIPTVPSRR